MNERNACNLETDEECQRKIHFEFELNECNAFYSGDDFGWKKLSLWNTYTIISSKKLVQDLLEIPLRGECRKRVADGESEGFTRFSLEN